MVFLPRAPVVYATSPRWIASANAQSCGRTFAKRTAVRENERDSPKNPVCRERPGGGEQRGPTPDVAKVLDFGLVKRMQGSGDDSLKSAVNTITGTLLYLSPEAILTPADVDGRSDLYALGCVGYWLLTGSHVFDAATIIEICGMYVHAELTPPSVRLGRPVPVDLERTIMSCLAKSSDRRPDGAAALYEELRACAVTSPWDAKSARQWWAERGRQLKRGAGEVRAPSSTLVHKRTINIDLRKRVSQG
jgi:eukaryotic-like serine/threonine-protein kinase